MNLPTALLPEAVARNEAIRRSRNVVDGEIRNTEPATGKSLPPVRVTPADEVRDTVRRAREAQVRWAGLSWAEREKRLLAFRALLVERARDVYEVLMREVGKPKFEALTHEVYPVADLAHFFGKNARRILRDETIGLRKFAPLKRSYLRYEPRGVIGAITPWNFPFSIPMGDVLMALAARNAVVVKPSEFAPFTMEKARELLVAAGIDPDLVGVVQGGGETGAALVASGVDMVIFTGSVATGRRVGAACGERLIPFVAELGGKDPAIVLSDVDVETVARQVVWGAFANSGQVCASVERVLVHESIHDPFVARVVELTRALRQGDPLAAGNEHVDVGAMVVPGQLDIVRKHVEEAVARGARVLAGGRAWGEGGARFFEPTVVVDVKPDMSIWREETFGPCLPVMRFRDEDEAVRLANESEYGLNGYVFSGDVRHGERIANRLRVGTAMVNEVLYTHAIPETPWGGVKSSGVGRVHGLQGLRDLCEIRHVNRPRWPASLPISLAPVFSFPYRERSFRVFERAMGVLYRSPWGRAAVRPPP
jgi:succinate-semialdehyde dehydrogenase/glutarate-semialdehyde dehydrogenase